MDVWGSERNWGEFKHMIKPGLCRRGIVVTEAERLGCLATILHSYIRR
jgi:hypothetical protein